MVGLDNNKEPSTSEGVSHWVSLDSALSEQLLTVSLIIISSTRGSSSEDSGVPVYQQKNELISKLKGKK